MKTAKQAVQEILDQIPEDASLEDIQYRIYVRQKVERGLDQADRGEFLTQEEVDKRLAKWLEP